MARSLVLATHGADVRGNASAESGQEPLGWAVAFAILVMFASQAGVVVQGNVPVLDGVLVGPDAYMRLARVERLWATGDWYDPVFPRIHPPDGFALHWTRPLDVLLLAGAWLATPFLGFHKALYGWGVLIGPVLHAVSLIAFVWAAAPVLPRRWLCWSAFLFVVQPAIFVSFLVGRPDHHGLLAVLLILMIGLTIRTAREPARIGLAVWLGAVSALAVWVSVESLLAVGVATAALALFWLLDDRRFAATLVIYSAATLAALLANLWIERGPDGFTTAESDRLSIAHATIFAVNLVFWLVVSGCERFGCLPRALAARIGWTALGGGVALAALAMLQPGLFANPLNAGDEFYQIKHLAFIDELQPLFGHTETGQDPWSVARPILWLGIAIPAGPWLVYRAVLARGRERRVWVYLGLGALAALPLAVLQRRWALYPEIFLLIPYAAFTGAVLERLGGALPAGVNRLARGFAIVTACVWFYVPSAFTGGADEPRSPANAAAGCPIVSLTQILTDPKGLGASPKRILAFTDVGPELLYRTPHSVYSIPNHRFQPGFATSYRIMAATELVQARELIDEAGVDVILVCPWSAESWFYGAEAAGPTLHGMLSRGEPPPFLEAISLPAAVGGRARLYAVRLQ